MPHDIGKDAADVVVRASHFHMVGMERGDELLLMTALVKFSIVEGDRERAHWLAGDVFISATITTSRGRRSDTRQRGRRIAANPRGISEHPLQRFKQRVFGHWRLCARKRRAPVLDDRHSSVLPCQAVSGRSERMAVNAVRGARVVQKVKMLSMPHGSMSRDTSGSVKSA